MAEIINLREFRKKRDRGAKATQAARNRALSGRRKADVARDRDAAERAESEMDGKKLDRADGNSDKSGDAE